MNNCTVGLLIAITASVIWSLVCIEFIPEPWSYFASLAGGGIIGWNVAKYI